MARVGLEARGGGTGATALVSRGEIWGWKNAHWMLCERLLALLSSKRRNNFPKVQRRVLNLERGCIKSRKSYFVGVCSIPAVLTCGTV